MAAFVRAAAYGALFLALTVLLAGSGAHAGPLQVLQENLAAGKPTVLIVSRKPRAADMKDEAYADWAGLLNDFAQEHRGRFEFLRIQRADLKRIFAARASIKNRFATIFFKNAENALYYDGMIHDLPTYRAVASFLSGKADAQAEELKALKPFRFRLRAARP